MPVVLAVQAVADGGCWLWMDFGIWAVLNLNLNLGLAAALVVSRYFYICRHKLCDIRQNKI